MTATVTPSLEVDDTALATPSLTPHCSTSTLSRSIAQQAALSKNRLAFLFYWWWWVVVVIAAAAAAVVVVVVLLVVIVVLAMAVVAAAVVVVVQ